MLFAIQNKRIFNLTILNNHIIDYPTPINIIIFSKKVPKSLSVSKSLIFSVSKRLYNTYYINKDIYVDNSLLTGHISDPLLNIRYNLVFDKNKAKENALAVLPSQNRSKIQMSTYTLKDSLNGLESLEIIDLKRLDFLITYTLYSSKIDKNTKKTILFNIDYIKKNVFFCEKRKEMVMPNSYKYLKEIKAGKLYTNVGLFNFPRKFRNYLAFNIYRDYDIKNSHFVFMQALARQQNLNNTNLTFFNENRKKILNELSVLNNVNYSTVKIDLLTRLNGDSFKFLENLGSLQKLIADLFKEVSNIRNFYSENLKRIKPEIFNYIQNSKVFKEKPLWKQKIRIQTLLCQILKSEALLILYKQIMDRSLNKNVSFICCYDGALINKETADFFTVNVWERGYLKEALSSKGLENVEFDLKDVETDELLLYDPTAYIISILLNQENDSKVDQTLFSFKNSQKIEQLSEKERLIAYNKISNSINKLSFEFALEEDLISDNFLNLIEKDFYKNKSRLDLNINYFNIS